MSDAVSYEIRDHAACVTLNLPRVRNALGRDLVVGLGTALARAVADDGARVVVLTGAGPVFCAGLNLKGDYGGFTKDAGASARDPSLYQSVMRALRDCPKPVLGRIQGSAFGAGFGLVLCCDIAIAVETAEFAVTELHFGLPPTLIPLLLHHKQLLGALRPMLYTGERFSAARAHELNVLHAVVPASALDDAVGACCQRLLRCAPEALATTKRIQRTIATLTFAEGLEFTGDILARAFSTSEAKEGLAAFAEKRSPVWAR